MAAGFSSTDVALEGFRITKERPLAVLAWAGVALVFSLITTSLIIAIAGSAFGQLMAGTASQQNPAVVMSQFERVAPAYGAISLVGLFFYALMYAAGNRVVLRPQDKGTAYLRVGLDELLQLVVMVLLWLIFVAVYIGLIILVLMLSTIVGVVSAPGAGLFVTVIGGLAILCFLIWLAVRLSLASAATFDTRQIGIAASWKLTRGRFWPLFGAYVLATILIFIVWLLGFVIIGALGTLMGGGIGAASSLFRPNFESFAAYFTPVMVLNLVLTSVLSALSLAVFVCTPAYAYRQITGREGVAVASTFE